MSDNNSLRKVVLEAGAGLFAVMDGAQFDDLPLALFDGDFTHRPLYLDRGNGPQDQLKTSPQLVWLDRDQRTHLNNEGEAVTATNEAVLDRLLELAGDRHAVVFWQCKAGGEALYRHLRGINMVFIPEDELSDEETAAEAAQLQSPSSVETGHVAKGPQLVLFRHADPNVLAQVLPALNEVQFARLFGPANLIAFAPEEQWAGSAGTLIAPRPDDLPAALAGPLQLDEAVMEHVGDARLAASRRNIEAYLQDTAPDYVEGMTNFEFQKLVARAQATGQEIGFQSEYGHGLWAFLTLITGGALLYNPDIRSHFATSDRLPDEVIEEVIEEVSEADEKTWEEWT